MVLTETQHAGGFIVSLATGTRSVEKAVILAGSGAVRALKAAMVVGKRIIGATATSTAFGGNTGNGVMGAITVTGPAKAGRYRLTVIAAAANAGAFQVFDPEGNLVESGNVASAFASGGLAFTLADGGTDFAVGDGFFLDVAPGTDKWLQLDTAGTLGEETAAGVLYDDITAPDGADKSGGAVIVRDAEVNAAELVWPAGISAANKAKALAELNELGIRER